MSTEIAPWQKDEQGNDVISIPDICGPSWWAMIHAWASSIESDGCSSCGEFAVKAVSALHDLVNVKLEKPIRDAANLAEFAALYTQAAEHLGHHAGVAMMGQVKPIAVTISGKCSGDTELCEFKVKASKVTEGVTGAISTLPMVVDEVRRRAQEAEQRLSPGDDRTFAFGSLSGTRYEFRFQLIEASSMIASNDAFTFAPNPDYPQELQPRLRDRASLRLQVETLAAKLNPELLLTDFHSLDRGAPIIGPDNVIESGNGRAMAIIRAVQQHPEVFANYRAFLSDRVGKFGMKASDVDALDAPVLVRVRVTDVDRIEFVQEANLSPAISSSSIEIALTDAAFITPSLLDSLVITEGQGIDEALRATRNTPFTSGFLAGLPEQERAKLVDADGRLNQDGVRRISMAIFARAFPGESGLRLAEHFFESVDANVKNVFNGILSALGQIVRAESLALEGDRDPELMIGEDLAKAVGVFSTIKATPGMTVDNFLAQSQLFERSLTSFQEQVLKALNARSRSSRMVAELLRSYANIVIKSPPPGQGTLIDIGTVTKEEAWTQAETMTAEPSTATLFQDEDEDEDLFILNERATGPGLTGIIPKEFAHLKVQTRLVRSSTFDVESAPEIAIPEDIQPFVRLMRDADREYLLVIFTDTKARVIGLMEANVGVRASSLVDFDAIMRGAILSGASNVFMAHNHPSGDPTPSPADRQLMELAKGKCSLLNIDFPDMLIVGKTRDFSMTGNHSLNAPVKVAEVGQDETEVKITGKCEGDVNGSCEFRVKKAEKAVKVQGVQAAIDAAKDIIERDRVGPGTGPVDGGRSDEVRPLVVELAGGRFEFAPETLIEMTSFADQTTKRERGFALCKESDGLIHPGQRCLGGTCSIRINDCLGKVEMGIFHTHPNDSPNNPAAEAAKQRTFSTTDLTPINRRRGKIQCVSGSRVGVITCGVTKPDAHSVANPGRANWPYIHPSTPDSLRNSVKAVRRTPGGKVSRNQPFQPNVGKQYDFVEFDKVRPGASLGQDDGLTEFALSLNVSGSGDFISEGIADATDFDDGSIRTIEQGDHRIRIGCPRGQWDGVSCLGSTKAQAILHPRMEQDVLSAEAKEKRIPVIGEAIMEALDELINSAFEEVKREPDFN